MYYNYIIKQLKIALHVCGYLVSAYLKWQENNKNTGGEWNK